MTVTTTYGLNHQTLSVLNGSGATDFTQLDATSLSGGGFAILGTHMGAHIDVDIYDSHGVATHQSTNLLGVNGSITQLHNGNIVVAAEDGANIQFTVMDAAGTVGPIGGVGEGHESNADVAGIGSNRFVIVEQRNFSATDNDIEVYIRKANGSAYASFAADSSSANDTNATVTGLDDGGFVVAWQRDDGANTSVWYEVYNSDGSQRLAAASADSFGSINRNVTSVALDNGGFALVYEDNGWGNGHTDITVARFNAAGVFDGYTRASTGATNDCSVASATVLSNGLIAITYSDAFSPTDHDMRLQLVDPNSGSVLLTSPAVIDVSTADALGSTMGATDAAGIAVGYNTGETSVGDLLQLVRTTTGDALDNVLAGDEAVDIMTGAGGNDDLSGGANNDTLNGGGGKDHIEGGEGADLLTGGAGKDIFVFHDNDSPAGSPDLITDLGNGKDKIDLSHIDADTSAIGDQAFTLVAAFTNTAGQLVRSYDGVADKTHFYMDVNGDSIADYDIQENGDQHLFHHFVL